MVPRRVRGRSGVGHAASATRDARGCRLVAELGRWTLTRTDEQILQSAACPPPRAVLFTGIIGVYSANDRNQSIVSDRCAKPHRNRQKSIRSQRSKRRVGRAERAPPFLGIRNKQGSREASRGNGEPRRRGIERFVVGLAPARPNLRGTTNVPRTKGNWAEQTCPHPNPLRRTRGPRGRTIQENSRKAPGQGSSSQLEGNGLWQGRISVPDRGAACCC